MCELTMICQLFVVIKQGMVTSWQNLARIFAEPTTNLGKTYHERMSQPFSLAVRRSGLSGVTAQGRKAARSIARSE